MKKIFSIISCLIICLFSFIACSSSPSRDIYDDFNDYISEIDGYQLQVKTSSSKHKLNSEYEIAYTQKGYDVTFTYEQLSKLDFNNPISEPKLTKSGFLKVENGVIVENSGDEIDKLPEKLNLSFKAEYFENVNQQNNTITAKIANIKGFLNKNVNVNNAQIKIEYNNQKKLKKLTIDYNKTEISTTIVYTF